MRRSLLVGLLVITVILAAIPSTKAVQADWYENYTLAVICHEQGRCLGTDAPDNVREYLSPIFGRLVQATPLERSEVGWFVTLEPSPNAWALKHYIGMTAGLLRLGLTRDEMAFVMGHELGHVQLGHFDEKRGELAKYYGIALLANLLSGGRYNPLNDPYYVTVVRIVMASYSRNLESQADMQGLHTMEAAGFDPSASVTALMKLDPLGLASRGDLFADHPTLVQRVSALEHEIALTAIPSPPVQTPGPSSLPSAPIPTGAESHLISPAQGIGPVRLGMKIDDIMGFLGSPKTTTADVSGNKLYSWTEPPRNAGLFVWVRGDGTIFDIGVTNDATYYTKENLHVGSTEAEVKMALGEPSRVTYEGNFMRLWYDSLGLRFSIYTGSGPASHTVGTIIVYEPS